jgi:hypothetical protein
MEAGLPSRLRNKDMNMVMRFGTWNVRTLLQAGNMNSTAGYWRRYTDNGNKRVEKAVYGKGAMEKNYWEG